MLPRFTRAHAPSQSMYENSLLPLGVAFLTLNEVASTLRVSPVTVHRLVRRGKLRATRVTRHFRFHRDDVTALLENGKAPNLHGTT
ncbi:MAG: helix-turn-helix domain-containing protein [Patescibacteria group bacterium]